MLRDLVIVGAGPVGATLALALADDGLDAVALDARPAGAIGRGDRSLALSHGARLILERLGIWGAVAARRDAVTPITAIDISQRGGRQARAARAARRRRVRALHARRPGGAPAGRRALRLRVDHNTGAGRESVGAGRRAIPGGAGTTIRLASRRA